MGYYARKTEEARYTDFSNKQYLTDWEAAAYTSFGRTKFRNWAEQIGCRRKVGQRVVNDKSVIDAALQNAKG